MPLANVVEGDPHVAAHNAERGVINELDENAIRKTLADEKGDILVATGPDTFVRLTAGANGKVLGVNSSTETGLEWVDGASGATGTNGWTPVYSVESDGTRRVLKIVDWTGGTGTKPSTTNQYVGSTGIVSSAAEAVDIRGPQGGQGDPGTPGNNGYAPVSSVESDGTRRVVKIVDWTGGSGTKPAINKYLGPTGFVDTAAEAVDIRGAAGTAGGDGSNGTLGWTPVLSVVSDGSRRVYQIVDWVGGTGTKPSTTNQFIGPSGIVGTAAAAVDIRGTTGATGPANSLSINSVDTVAADQPTTVTVGGTAPNQTLSFSIARGFTGPQGPPGPYGKGVMRTMSSGVLTLDPTVATDYTITLTGNISLAIGGLFPNAGIVVDLVQDSVGSRTVTIPTSWTGYEQVLLSTAPNTVDRLLVTRNGYGYMVQLVFSAPVASGVWTPNSLSNKTAWFSANAIGGEPGDTVSAFPNQFGTGDLSTLQGAPKLGLLNGQKYVYFDGVDDALGGTHGTNLVQPFWIAGVFRVPGNGPVIGGPSGQTTAADILVTGGNWSMEPSSGMTIANTGAWVTMIARYVTGGNDFFHIDSTVRNDVNVNTLKVNQWTKLGGDDLGAFGEAYVAEVIKCAGLLDAPTLANLQTYLNRIRDDLKGVV